MTAESISQMLNQRPQGMTLPRQFYTSEDIFQMDLEAVFSGSWLFAGFCIEIPNPGDFLSIDIGPSPILVLRDHSGEIRGFFNTCRHRGARIFPAGSGNAKTVVCPYHQWTYGLDGSLRSARDMPSCFDKKAHGLNPIQVRIAAGCIYVCLAKTVPDFEPFKAAIEELLAPHDLENTKIAHQYQLVENANWKLVMENARECYHCNACHPMLINTINVDPDEAELAYRDNFFDRMSSLGIPVGPKQGDWWDASRRALRKGTKTISPDGNPVVQKKMCATENGDVGSMRWGIEPNFFAHALGDYLFTFSALPTAPQQTVVTAKWLVRKDAEEGVDYDLDRLIEAWDVTNREDKALAENNQDGVNSIGYTPGPFNPTHESYVLRFNAWYRDKISKYYASSLRRSQ